MNNTKITKRLLLASSLVAMLVMAAPGKAQAPAADATQDQSQTQAAPAKGEGKHMRAFENLNLTDDQKAQMKQIRTDSKTQLDAVNADTSLAADAKQAKIHQIRKGTHEQMMKVLTADQKKQLKQNMREHRSERQQSQPQSQPPATPQQ